MQPPERSNVDWTGVQPDQSPIEPLDDKSFTVRLRLLSERARSLTIFRNVVPSLNPESWQAAVDLLWSLGARPRIPEPLDRIRDVEQVRTWRADKGMLALNFRTPDGSTEVDLLVSESDQFEALRQRAVKVTIEQRTFFIASIEDLIATKQQAGRPQDLLDVEQLRDIQKRLES